MTKEDKELLAKDLCARLPYGVRGVHRGRIHYLMNVDWGFGDTSIQVDEYSAWFAIDTFKPYLRSMSSMTEEERKEYEQWLPDEYCINTFDWLNKNMFDYRGLIPRLALEAPEGMYK